MIGQSSKIGSGYLFIVPSLSGGGAERVVSVLADQLALNGARVMVLVYFRAPMEYPMRHAPRHTLYPSESEYEARPMPERLREIRTFALAYRPKFVIPFLHHVCFHVWAALLGTGLPVIATVRNHPRYSVEHRMKQYLCTLAVRQSRGCLIQTEAQRALLPRRLARRAALVPNPVSREMFDIPREPRASIKRILAVGRLVPQKNYGLLIGAFARLRAQRPDLTLSIYGDGQMLAEWQALAERLSVGTAVRFEGCARDMSEVYRQADLFVLCSDYEGLPNALMEAMTSGLPCIATHCPTGPSALIRHEVNGLLIPCGDEAALVWAMERLIDQPDFAAALAARAAEDMRAYSPEAVAARFIDACDGVLSRKGCGG